MNHLKKLALCGAVSLTLTSCAIKNPPAFNPKTCLNDIPGKVEGLAILQGMRHEKSIISDMQSAYCNGQVLLKRMHDNGEKVGEGTLLVKVTAEYTGEVVSAQVVKTTGIDSEIFQRRVSDFITDSDFTPWQRSDEDSIFLYPLQFTHWWE